MNYYPVCIPTLNRYEHLKACVESLQQCTHADKTELIIGLDALPPPPNYEVYREGYEKVKAYLPTINGFAKVTILERDSNYGAERNSDALEEYCLERYDAYIFTEDDNVFSPCFLDFMNKALDKYRDDERVASVCGFCRTEDYGISSYSAYLAYDDTGWGVGYWGYKRFEYMKATNNKTFFRDVIMSKATIDKFLDVYPEGLGMLLDMIKMKQSWGDVKHTAYNIMTGHFQVKPSISMVRNRGFDGSGIHCSIAPSFSQQIITQQLTYDLPNLLEVCRSKTVDTDASRDEIARLRKRVRRHRLRCMLPEWLLAIADCLWRKIYHSRQMS
jgi:glycosyltransferase involved in cell wall biosynthesis